MQLHRLVDVITNFDHRLVDVLTNFDHQLVALITSFDHRLVDESRLLIQDFHRVIMKLSAPGCSIMVATLKGVFFHLLLI